VRLLYFAHATNTYERQLVDNAVRVIPELTHVFPVVAQGAIAIRGIRTASHSRNGSSAKWIFRGR
jgi:hypothetical protein